METCKWGHEMTPDNTYVDPSGKKKQCKTCRNKSARESARRNYVPVSAEKRKYRTDLTAPKKCPRCGQVKSLDQFYKCKGAHDGVQSRCIPCSKELVKLTPEKLRIRNFKVKYGITLADYDLMLQEQNDGCAICGRKASEERFGVLSVDHCHDTGRVRGLLCEKHNMALGMFGDDIELLNEAIRYLSKGTYTMTVLP